MHARPEGPACQYKLFILYIVLGAPCWEAQNEFWKILLKTTDFS